MNWSKINVPKIIIDEYDLDMIIKVEDLKTLKFTIPKEFTTGDKDIKLEPFYSIHHERYTIYFDRYTKEEFKNVEMLETTIVKDNFYGLSLNEYLSKKGNCVVVVDPNGTKQLIDKIGKENLVTILLDIDLEERKQNMLDRGDTIEAIEKRLLNEDFVNDYYNLGLKPDILIQERLEEPKILLDKINDFLNFKIDIER